jgi:dTDP-glucose 4,6-dehydratase
MKKVLITGCAGFIGSHATEYFIKMGCDVVGIDDITYAGSYDNMSNFLSDIEFIRGDISNYDLVGKIVRDNKIDWIVNFAAETHVDNSIRDSKNFIKSNILGIDSLLRASSSHGCNILHVSTDEVYGSILEGSFKEEDRLSPTNPYSATKAAAELMIKAFENTFKTNSIIVRMSNNFGPRQHSEKLIPTVIRSIRKKRKIPVYGNGDNIRDWMYVKDSSKMIYDVMQRGKFGQVYNLTHLNEMKNIEVISLICQEMKVDLEESIMFVKDRLGHDFRYSIDNQKVKKISNSVMTRFEDAIRETVNFYSKNQEI